LNRGYFARNLRNDSAQEALLRVWKVREQYHRSDTRAFKAWFRKICRSSGADVLRRSRDPVPTVAAMESLRELPSKGLDDPANDASKFERHRNVKECLEILKRNKPAVFAAVLVTVLMDETERGADAGKTQDKCA